MKKSLFIIITIMSIMSIHFSAQAQEVKSPLDPLESTSIIPPAPGPGMSWVKAHWSWDGGKYIWEKGTYVETRKGYSWVDGQWERNPSGGWWKFHSGYWQKEKESSEVKNDTNTSEEVKENKEQRQQNKVGGLFIKTGSSN